MKSRKKRNIIICFITIICILVELFYIIETGSIIKIIDKEILGKFVGEPILEDGIINNSYFGINEQGKYAKNTTEGINNAILYAKKNNISYLKLKKGKYLIDGSVKNLTFNNTKKGIILESNIIFDLNGSTILQEKNDKERYSIFSIYDVENVVIKNGTIIGDKDVHDYKINATHEWGYGVDIKGSYNIEIDNLQISKMTGDGICIGDLKEIDTLNKEIRMSENVNISNCNIYDCRRQGISAISVKKLNIYKNEIHNIKGTNPQAAIDLETNDDGTQKVDEVKIYENKLYDLGLSTAILNYSRIYNVEIYNNEIDGKIVIYENKDKIAIYDNKIKNADIIIKIEDSQYKKGVRIENVVIENNTLINASIKANRTKKIEINNNIIENGYIELESCNGIVQNNKVIVKKQQNFAYKYGILLNDHEKYTYTIFNNMAQGIFIESEKKEANPNIVYK